MDRRESERIIQQSSLAANATRLISMLRPTARLLLEPIGAKQVAIGKSRFGGDPDLPKGFVWPKGRDGEPLSFIGQLQLSNFSSDRFGQDPPYQGLLQFYYDIRRGLDGDDLGFADWRVIHFDKNQELHRTAGPASSTQLRECSVATTSGWMLPTIRHLSSMPEWLSQESKSAFEQLGASLISHEVGQSGEPTHRLLGYPVEVQNSIRQECFWPTREFFYADDDLVRTHGYFRDEPPWRLLLQVDTDVERLGIEWNDGGMLYFCIRDDDLRINRFDRVWVLLQSC